jgi:molybdenum cofactor biosynthesis enzyme MoaA
LQIELNDQFLPYLHEAVQLGVKEFYFTGGEPFINPDLLEATLQVGPATVLTNATLLCPQVVRELASMRDASTYSLELRVSMDGFFVRDKRSDPRTGHI